MDKKKIGLIIVFIGAVASFFIFDIGQYLNLAYIKSQQQLLNDYYANNPIKTASLFFIAYILITGASLPGAGIMTLVGGAIFGLVWGTILVSFGSVIGATIAFLITRYLFRDYIQKRFAKQLEPINAGVRNEGGFYLFTLRLVPVFPFFVINSLMALTPMKTLNFALISQIGMLAGTIVFVNAGTQLAKVEALGDILSPGLLFSFVLLGVFPLIAKKLVNFIKQQQQANSVNNDG